MQTSPRLLSLRQHLQQLHRQTARQRDAASTISPWIFLAIPLPERLILLARYDGVSAYETHRQLHVPYKDAELATDRMEYALHRLRESMQTPFLFLADEDLEGAGYTWSDRQSGMIERRLRQLFFPEVAMALFGESMPSTMLQFTLRERALVYVILVEEADWNRAQEVLGCTRHFVKATLRRMMETLEPATKPATTPL